jgi:C-terminal peptidase (prc)
MHNNLQKKYLYKNLLIIALVAFISFYLGKGYSSHFAKNELDNLYDSKLLSEIKEILQTDFVSPVGSTTLPTQKEISDGMIAGYVSAYRDIYTQYFPPKEAKIFEENINGSFGGIGIQVGIKDGLITVIAPIKGSVADRNGIKSGDVILAINGEKINKINIDDVVSKIRGEVGTSVFLEIFSKEDGVKRELKLIREIISLPSIESEYKGDIKIIKVFTFNLEVERKFMAELQDMIDKKVNKLIIDLRGNPGGLLSSAIGMTSFFLPEGKIIVTEKRGAQEEIIHLRSDGRYLFKNKNIKVVVLVDEGSASASEIMAGALKDHGVAKIVGRNTYGKGSVQQIYKLSDGSSLKVTIAKWLTPQGVSITENGIKPDIDVEIKKSDIEKKIDTQLNEAINLLKK